MVCTVLAGSVRYWLGLHGTGWVCKALTAYVSYGWVYKILAGSVRYWMGL